jgi:flagellar protein FliS
MFGHNSPKQLFGAPMNHYAKSADTYLAQRILGAGPEQQAALIMEAGQLHLRKAIAALSKNDFPAAARSFIRVSEVIMEATVRLNLEGGGDLAQNLQKLYTFWTNEIMIASQTRNTVRLEAVVRGMGDIRAAWEALHKTKTEGAGNSSLQLGDRIV